MEQYHPAHDIKMEISNELEGKCVILGVTGSVAIYRSLDVARGLIRRGASVHVVMSRSASNMVSPQMFYWATGEEPIVDITGRTEHITLARKCDAMIIAPATLSTMSKILNGTAEGGVALTAISLMGYKKPLLLVPAMHLNMYQTIQAQKIVKGLIELGINVLEPVKIGNALKMPSPNDIVRWATAKILRGNDLAGYKLLVTAGATREYIDAVRFISNPGSGRMGIEIAAEAAARGAQVSLITGHTEVEIPAFITTVKSVETTEEMATIIRKQTSREKYDALIAAASPVDFRPESKVSEKLPSGSELIIHLKPTSKSVSSFAKRPRLQVIFVAEVGLTEEELVRKAREKIEKYGADLAIANDISKPGIGFAAQYNQVIIVKPDGEWKAVPKTRKEIVARLILDEVRDLLAR